MINKEIKEKIQSLIANNKTAEAIRELLKFEDNTIRNQTIILSSRYRALIQSVNVGIVNQEDIETEKNQINNSLLNLSNDITDSTVVNNIANKKLIQKMESNKSRFDFYSSIIGMVTAILALLASGFGIYKSFDNSEKINTVREMANKFEIVHPKNGDTLRDETIKGYYYGELPKGKEFRVFVKDNAQYHSMVGTVDLFANGDWEFTNLKIYLSGELSLIVCLVNKEISKGLDIKHSNNDFSALNKIGKDEGIIPVDKVKIFKNPKLK